MHVRLCARIANPKKSHKNKKINGAIESLTYILHQSGTGLNIVTPAYQV